MKYLSLIIYLIVAFGCFCQSKWEDNGTIDNSGVYYKTYYMEGEVSKGDTLKSLPFTMDDTDGSYSLWVYFEHPFDSVGIFVVREVNSIREYWHPESVFPFFHANGNSAFNDTIKSHMLRNRFLVVGDQTCGDMVKFRLKAVIKKLNQN